MPDTVEDPVHDAELAVFERKSLALDAAAAGGLPGAFESFRLGGLRASIATADQYGFLNTVEGLNEHSVEHLPEVLNRFANRHQITIIATSPSQALNDRMLDQGYELAPVRPIAVLRVGAIRPDGADRNQWEIREISSAPDAALFADLLDAGYAATDNVRSLIRTEHALPMVRAFIAFRNGEPLAAAAMSVQNAVAVLGGASTLPTARGAGAQSALLGHRIRVARAFGCPLAAATAAPRSPSVRNLARLGFTIVERTAWRVKSTTSDEVRGSWSPAEPSATRG